MKINLTKIIIIYTMVDRTPIEVDSANKPKAEARPGNIALEVERPLFKSGGNWDYYDFRNYVLQNTKDLT